MDVQAETERAAALPSKKPFHSFPNAYSLTVETIYYLVLIETARNPLPDKAERVHNVAVKLTEEFREQKIANFKSLEPERRMNEERALASMEARSFIERRYPDFESVIVLPEINPVILEDPLNEAKGHVFEVNVKSGIPIEIIGLLAAL